MISTPDQRLKVFVSSTLSELAEERVAVRQAVTRLRLTPVMFEMAARSHSPRALYRAYEQQSDVFIGIYWRSYGWVAPGEAVSGIEDEWQRAGGLPRLVYLKVPAPEQDARLGRMLSRIKDDEQTSYRRFSTAQELRALVEDDLAILLTERFVATRHDADRAGALEAQLSPEPGGPAALPAPLTSLVGRARELKVVQKLLSRKDVRLVTLTGPGGIGKSRLAAEIGARVEASFPDGVRFVELAATTDPQLVATAIAGQLGMHPAATQAPGQVLATYLRAKRLLLILDNFEQVTAAAAVVSDLLAAAAGVTILVTSRTVLNLRGEHDVPLAPLSVPRAGSGARTGSAVQLFTQRAQAVDPRFRLTGENGEAVAEITRRLDGLPLAIELAAARTRLLPPQALLARLRDGAELPGAGPSNAPDRQRTLSDTIAWSYNLLTGPEQRLFTALGVFSGGFDLPAVEALNRVLTSTDEQPGALLTLGSLVDKSLVRVVTQEGQPRFDLLETIRDYARRQLSSSKQERDIRSAHTTYYLGVAEAAGPGLRGPQQQAWLRRLDTEYDNVRVALTWALEQADLESAERIGWGIWMYWFFGHIDEGARWFSAMVDSPAPATAYQRARALAGAGLMRFALGDAVGAESALDEGLQRYREAGDRPGIALASGALGHLATVRQDYERAEGLLRESLDLYHEIGDDWYTAMMLNFLGELSLAQADHDRAVKVFAAALDLSRQVGGSVPLLLSLYNVATTDLAGGNLTAAERHFSEGLAHAVDLGDKASAVPYLAGLAQTADDPERAAHLQSEAESLGKNVGGLWLHAYSGSHGRPRRRRGRDGAGRRPPSPPAEAGGHPRCGDRGRAANL